MFKTNNPRDAKAGYQHKRARANFALMERREWWLCVVALVITLVLTCGLISFLLPNTQFHQDFVEQNSFPEAIKGLVALVFLFDLYTIYQHFMIYQIRKQLGEREALFHLISENAADMIAVVDMEGRRIYNSLSYQSVLGYSPEELQASSAFEQIHPEDRERVEKAAEEVRLLGTGKTETWATIARNHRQVAAISSQDHGNLGMLRKGLGFIP